MFTVWLRVSHMGIVAVFAKLAFTEKKILANVLKRCLSINWWIGVDNY